jgi:hypothetical protein
MPSNIVVSMIFMSLTRGVEYAAAASVTVPLGMAVDTLFLLVLVAALPLGLVRAFVLAFGAWGLSAFLVIKLPVLAIFSVNSAASIGLYILVVVLSFLIAEFPLAIRAVARKPSGFRPSVLLIRALFAGTVVASAVAIAQVAPPAITGIVATFPAVLTSTMVILVRSQGTAFARATGKVLILSSSNIIIYALMIGIAFPSLGPWWGSLAAFVAAILYISLFLPIVRKIR